MKSNESRNYELQELKKSTELLLKQNSEREISDIQCKLNARTTTSPLDLGKGSTEFSSNSLQRKGKYINGKRCKKMMLDEIVSWYQKKIGTYDKEPWEKTVEQKILDGFSSVTLKTAKLKTELIDVDLVRGSTFPKAKPKQSLLTVIRLAILRYIFMPLYARWWVKQTSPNAFALLFLLYLTQMVNWAFYSLNVNRHDQSDNGVTHAESGNVTTKVNATGDKSEHIVSLSELLIPTALSLLLSLIHSQIVATSISQSEVKCKKRRYSNSSISGRTGKLRRRKKLVKIRAQDAQETSSNTHLTTTQRSNISLKKYASGSLESSSNPIKGQAEVPTQVCPSNFTNTRPSLSTQTSLENTTVAAQPQQISSSSGVLLSQLKLDIVGPSHNLTTATTTIYQENDVESPTRKRNVNWQFPVHKLATSTQEKHQQTSPPQSFSTTSSAHTSQIGENSSVSSNSPPSLSPLRNVNIDECVQEFIDDLINQTTEKQPTRSVAAASQQQDNIIRPTTRRTVGEDDGFESLNGKSSSGEDTNATTQTQRLRLNTLGNHQKVQQLSEASQDTITSTSSCYHRKVNPYASDVNDYMTQLKNVKSRDLSSDETEEEGDEGEFVSSPVSQSNNSKYNECTTSATEWLGITTNTDECSYSSDYANSDGFKAHEYFDENGYDYTPNTILNPYGSSDKISCTVWDQREIKKAQMSVLEISSAIIAHVESMPETNDYIYIGIFFSFVLSLIPCFCRLCEITMDSDKSGEVNYFDLPMILWEKASFSFTALFRFAFGDTQWERTVSVIGVMQRLCLTLMLFMIFAVAERTFKQRFLYAKLFSHLTSSRRARKSNLPHFRLNKVRNIKTWLSVRSYLKKRGPQRSVDVIVSAAFIVTLLLLAFLSVEWLKDSVHLHSHLNLEALLWSTTIGVFLLRFMTLGNKIHQKYRSISVLITEQINLYLQIEKKPKKKDELMVSNSVLKLAADLLKELETPFKISGLSANPYLFTTIKVVILSALSGVLSEMLGFKLKLHKIKIK